MASSSPKPSPESEKVRLELEQCLEKLAKTKRNIRSCARRLRDNLKQIDTEMKKSPPRKS